MRRILLALGATACVTGILATGSGWASAAPRATFAVAPVPLSGAARPEFSFGVTAGARVADAVEILNYSSSALQLQVNAEDAVQASDGGFGLLLPTQRSVGVGAWISFSRPHLTVVVPGASAHAPGVAEVPFTLQVPATASPGDHAGAVLATLVSVGTSASGKRIILDQRLGARVFVTVAGSIAAGLSVRGLSVSASGGEVPWQHDDLRVQYTLVNTGNADLAVDQRVSGTPLVTSATSASLPRNPILLPGGTLHESVRLRGLWPALATRVVVDAQGTYVGVDGVTKVVSATASTWVITFPWLLLVAVILIAGGLWLVRRGRRAAPTTATTEPTPHVEVVA